MTTPPAITKRRRSTRSSSTPRNGSTTMPGEARRAHDVADGLRAGAELVQVHRQEEKRREVQEEDEVRRGDEIEVARQALAWTDIAIVRDPAVESGAGASLEPHPPDPRNARTRLSASERRGIRARGLEARPSSAAARRRRAARAPPRAQRDEIGAGDGHPAPRGAGWGAPAVTLIAETTGDPFRVLISTILSLRTQDETTAVASRRLFARADDPGGDAAAPRRHDREADLPGRLLPDQGARHPRHLPRAARALRRQGAVRSRRAAHPERRRPQDREPRPHARLPRPGHLRRHPRAPHHQPLGLRPHQGARTTPSRCSARSCRAEHWIEINDILVAFGQRLCRPISPHCSRCPIVAYCPRRGVTRRASAERVVVIGRACPSIASASCSCGRAKRRTSARWRAP